MPTLHFKGKNIIWNHHLSVPYHTLEEVDDLSFQAEKSNGNLIIEGDNLTALKALLPQYGGRVKCIYIDPPYNTGNEGWTYNDNANNEMIRSWLGKEVGKDDLTRHDKWLCMLTPRLKLLKELLHAEGVIFISIDNNEIHNLRCLMDAVFGEENFVAQIANVNNPKGRSDDKYVPTAHEYLLVYKNLSEPDLYGWKPEEKVIKRYRKTDPDGKKWREIDLRKTGDNDLREDRENLFYYFLYNKKTKDFFPTRDENIPEDYIRIKPLREDGKEGNWRWELETSKDKIAKLFPKLMPKRKVWSVFEKDYLNPDEKIKPTTSWTKKEFNSERGTEQFLALGFEKKDFPKPKPIGLLKHILEYATTESDIILDSFAGSGTTLHAVMELNKEDNGMRQCILIQMKEDTPSEPEKNICKDITRERVKRAIERYGYNSGFNYLKVGIPIDPESMLEGNLPSYQQFAQYVYYLATGEYLADKDKTDIARHYIGTRGYHAIFLIYEQDMDKLTRLALNLDAAKQIIRDSPDKRRIVYAPACFLDDDYMEEHQIEFVSIPYNLFERKQNA